MKTKMVCLFSILFFLVHIQGNASLILPAEDDIIIGRNILTASSLHVSASGSDSNPGTKVSPLRNIQTALSQAINGDTIKVAEGTYQENLITQVRVVLRGGYNDSFSERERNIYSNKSKIRASSGSMLIDANNSTIDGLVFDGSGGAQKGIVITNGLSILTHNIVYNITKSGGSCIEVIDGASAVIKNNTVANNVLSGGGVIVYAIYVRGSTPSTIQNNIAYNNNAGIYITPSGSTKGYNCSYDNTYMDFDGANGSALSTDFSKDPQFVNPANNDFRLKVNSPCMNTGNPNDDYSNEPDPNGGRIDLGAYGGTNSATLNENFTTYVSPSGNDSNNGSIDSPKKTIQAALTGTLGDTIKVMAGTYSEGIITTAYAVILGGYDNTFSDSDRDPYINRTTLLGISATMVYDHFGCVIDGFFLDGNGVASKGFDIGEGTVLSHNVIVNIIASSGFAIDVGGNVSIVNNTIYNCGYGISVSSGTGSLIRNNIFASTSFAMSNNSADGISRYNDYYGNSFNYVGFYTVPGIGDLAVNPQFRNSSNNDFGLLASSLCIDKGDPDTDNDGLSWESDIDDQDADGSRPDIGAYPFIRDNTQVITILTPNGGEVWTGGSTQNIIWTSSNVDNVKIEYSTNNGLSWITIISNTLNDGLHLWNIPNVNSNQCLIKISDVNNNVTNDISDVVFYIYSASGDKLFTQTPNNLGINTTNGQFGSGWVDIDNDGDLDLFIVGVDHTHVLYRNGNNSFTDVSTLFGFNNVGLRSGAQPSCFDYEGDGDLDLLIASPWDILGGFILYRNDNSIFHDISTEADLGSISGLDNHYALAVGDYDKDGDPDIAVAGGSQTGSGSTGQLFILENNNGRYTDVTTDLFETTLFFESWGITWIDYDNDNDLDLWIPTIRTPHQPCAILVNQGDKFILSNSSLTGINAKSAIVSSWIDYNNDGNLDLFVIPYVGDDDGNVKLYRNNNNGTFTETAGALALDSAFAGSRGISWGDYDNDGDIDLLIANRSGTQRLYRNDNSMFVDVSAEAGVDFSDVSYRAVHFVDYDNDGFLDIYFPEGDVESPSNQKLLHNSGNSNHWIVIKPKAISDNNSVIGTRVRVVAGDLRMMRDIQSTGPGLTSGMLWAHFGLGSVSTVDSVIVEWPNGNVDVTTRPEIDKYHTITESISSNTASAYFKENARIRVLDSEPVNPEANPSSYKITGNQITVEAWVFPFRATPHMERDVIISRPYNDEYANTVFPFNAYALRIENTGDDDSPRFNFYLSNGDSARAIVDSPDPVQVGEWTHIAGTYDGSSTKLLINGNVVAEVPFYENIGEGNTGLYIGGITNWFFNGLIDEVRLWNISRTEEEIKSAMNRTLNGDEFGLAGYWTLNESTGVNGNSPVTIDMTGNHNDLWIQNGAEIVEFVPGDDVFVEPSLFDISFEAEVGTNFTELLPFSGYPQPDFNLISGPSGLNINSLGYINWTPQTGESGYHDFTIQAVNSAGSSQKTYVIWVDAYQLESKENNNNEVMLTVFNNGVLGKLNGEEGEGFTFNNTNGLYNGTLVIGKSINQVSGRLYDHEFRRTNPIIETQSRLDGFDQSIQTSFDDSRSLNPINIEINLKTHSKSTDPDKSYIIVEYEIEPHNVSTDQVYVGLTFDWDVGNPNNNMGGFDNTRNLSYVYETANNPSAVQNDFYYGVVLLSGTLSGHRIWSISDSSFDEYADASYFDALTNISDEILGPFDLRSLIASGPYDLSRGSARVAFALVAGNNLDELKTNTDAALSVNLGYNETISISSPNGGEIWSVGSTQEITWSSSLIDNVKIEYTVNSGSSWTEIVSSTPSDGNYSWNIPDLPSSFCMIKISDASDGYPEDISDAFFTIAGSSSISLLSPNGGENWFVGEEHPIEWQSTNIDSIVISFSSNSGNNWDIIEESFPAAGGKYNWIVPDISPSGTCIISVHSTRNPLIADYSDAAFSVSVPIIPALEMIIPNGGEIWTVGSQQQIKWSSQYIDDVKISYTTNNGDSWPVIAASVTASDGSYNWTVPNTPSPECLVMVSDVNDDEMYDHSDAMFTIVAPASRTVTVISPNGGESWVAGSSHIIQWNSNFVNNVKIEYSINNGTSWNIIAASTPSAGSYNWSVPSPPSPECLIRISDASDNFVFDISDAAFTIAPGTSSTITVVSPNGGEQLITGQSIDVQWSSANVGNVQIDYSTDNGISWAAVISSVSAAVGKYTWTVPNTPSQNCLVRISDKSNGSIFDQSDAPFSIVLPPASIILVSPAGGGVYMGGSGLNISWTSANISSVTIEYSTNGGTTWYTIITSVSAITGNYTWTLPNAPINNCLIRISDASNHDVYSTCQNSFEVFEYLTSISLSASLNYYSGNNTSSYRIVGLPGNINLPISQVLSGTYDEDWKAFYDDGSDADYLVEYDGTNAFNFRPGRAFWIINKNAATINENTSSVSLNNLYYYSIPLHSGWNLISNPFDKNVSWENVTLLNNISHRIYWFNGSAYVDMDTMEMYRGYYYYNQEEKASLVIPYLEGASSGSVLTKNIQSSRELVLTLNDNNDKLGEVTIGFADNSLNSYDKLDIYAPPGDFIKNRIVIFNNELESSYKYLYKDYRSGNDEGLEYVIEIKKEPGKELILKTTGIELFDDYEIYITHERLENFYNLKSNPTIVLNTFHEGEIYRLLIGNRQYIERETVGLAPNEYKLYQNYPNPFNGSTIIRFSLPERDVVSLEIYNVLGELVTKIIDNVIYEAGRHEVLFDADILSTGIYICQYKTNLKKLSNKIIYIK
ncbi:MAG: VCBS repeat-containing protein [Melioribacteraceae bacterium]|nr:VCBS repeat-containing protein [Melioribacteraceae bacterium]